VSPELAEAHIECTDNMLDKILHEDDDSLKLMVQPKFHEIFAPFESTIEEQFT